MTGPKILLDVLEENNKLLQMISAMIAAHPPLTSSERSGRCRKMLLNFLGAILLLILIAIIVFYLYKIDTKLDMLEKDNKNISSRLDLVPSGEDYEGEYLIAYEFFHSTLISLMSLIVMVKRLSLLGKPCLLKKNAIYISSTMSNY